MIALYQRFFGDQDLLDEPTIPSGEFAVLTETETGCGIGLSVVQEIVKSSDGFIRVNSIEGKRTTFLAALPIALCPPTSNRSSEE